MLKYCVGIGDGCRLHWHALAVVLTQYVGVGLTMVIGSGSLALAVYTEYWCWFTVVLFADGDDDYNVMKGGRVEVLFYVAGEDCDG